jgi:hypothetical protein
MTTVAPDGAYIIGGGRLHFGQTATEDLARAAFEYPMPNFDNMLAMLQTMLEQLPLGALEPFKEFLGLGDDLFGSVAQAVKAIMDSLMERPVYLFLNDLILAITGSNVVQTLEELAEWINENIIDAIADLAARIIDFVTKNELAEAIAKVISDIVKAITGGLGDTLEFLAHWFQQNVMNVIAGLATQVGDLWDAIVDFVTNNQLTQIITALIRAITGGAIDTIEALGEWFQTNIIGKLATLTTQVAGILAQIVDFITDSELAAALSTLTGQIVQAFTGAVGTLGDLTTWVASNVTGAIAGVLAKLQELIDSIVQILTPGAGGNNPISAAIDVIKQIFGIASNADTSAAQNAAAIQGILAGQAGGFTETFDYAKSDDLYTVSGGKWRFMNGSLNDRYGTDGMGNAVGIMDGTRTGLVWEANSAQPLTTADMQVTGVLSRLPWWNLTVKSGWLLMVQCSSVGWTDQSCYGVEMLNTQARFFRQDASGNQTDLGPKIAIPENAVGIPYTLRIKGNKLSLIRNNIEVAAYTGVTPLTGRCIGFGGWKVPYVNPTDNPLAHFAGISWMPAP